MLNKDPCFAATPEVKKICDDYFGQLELNLHYFGHGITFPDGRFSCLMSDTGWSEYFFVENDFPPSGYTIYDQIESSVKLPRLDSGVDFGWSDKEIRLARDRFGLENLMVIYRKYEDHLQCFFFDLHDKKAHEKYINHFDIFENFIFYYKDRAKDLLKMTSRNMWQVSDQVRASKKMTLRDYDVPLPKQYFLRLNGKESSISVREYQCLELLAHGAKFKELSDVLNISLRTTETYVGNLKKKLGVYSLSEAIKIYWQNRITG